MNQYERAEASYVFYNFGNQRPSESDSDNLEHLHNAMEHLMDFVEAGRRLRRTMHPLQAMGKLKL